MTRREIAFLLIGLGLGLAFSLVAILAVLLSLYKNSLITGYGWDKVLLVLPILLLMTGIALLAYRSKRTPNLD